jgi:hypothetical protein
MVIREAEELVTSPGRGRSEVEGAELDDAEGVGRADAVLTRRENSELIIPGMGGETRGREGRGGRSRMEPVWESRVLIHSNDYYFSCVSTARSHSLLLSRSSDDCSVGRYVTGDTREVERNRNLNKGGRESRCAAVGRLSDWG